MLLPAPEIPPAFDKAINIDIAIKPNIFFNGLLKKLLSISYL
jgi:hypothetical protein